MLSMFIPLIMKAAGAQAQQAAPGARANPTGSFSHFMGATNANIADPLNIFGQSGNNPVNNFLNPAGATLIKGMTPSNSPLPVGAGTPGGPSGQFPLGQQGTGISQMNQLGPAFNNYLGAIGRPPMPFSPPPATGQGQPSGGGMNPASMQTLLQLSRQRPTLPMPTEPFYAR